jgi:ammonium transporter Rh
VHGTLLIGFGFLVAFLRRYGFGSITMNMMITAFTLELAVSKIYFLN